MWPRPWGWSRHSAPTDTWPPGWIRWAVRHPATRRSIPATLGLTPEIQATIPASVLRVAVPGRTLAEALPHLRATYCGTIAYEVEHISVHEERVWLRQMIESGAHRIPLAVDQKWRLLQRLVEVEAFERFLHKAYLGQKRFSIEGLDAMVPMLDLVIELASAEGAREVVLGMAHRGRLNVLAHTVGRPYQALIAEFEGSRQLEDGEHGEGAGTGDVKYHIGAEGAVVTPSGRTVTVTLSPNPSHLEFVGPVVVGRARAEQTQRRGSEAIQDSSLCLPVVIHGDAAFAAQGVVAETLNLGTLPGYSTGGTIHLIANNQIGFTTDIQDSRSTRYASDLAKGFDIPIIHVNADDPEACLAAVRLAMMYRDRFHQDALIDLVGYRRHGHNEGDEPTYTQPLMYARIKEPSHRPGELRGKAGRGEHRLRRSGPDPVRYRLPAADRDPAVAEGATGRRQRVRAVPQPARLRHGYRDRRHGRPAPGAQRAAHQLAGRIQDPPEAGPAARAPADQPARRAPSTGATPRPWPSRHS